MASLPWICRSCRSHVPITRIRSAVAATKRLLSSNSKFFKVSEEVQQALHDKKPVVALESTIYTHGWPYPDNLALAAKLESLVRLNGGVPATIGVLEGVAKVGLAADELVRLVAPSSTKLLKLSRRDFGFVLGMRDAEGRSFNGGTTISGTMVLAHKAGIKVFATGGLGGVHRGAEATFDISADLTELGRTPLCVISSGCKSFLDIPKTLEYLETQGCAVATFADGRSGEVDFPAFYTRDSGVRSPMVLKDEVEAARVIFAQSALGLESGMHFASPIPEQFSLPLEAMEAAIAQALKDASAAGATGNASTPFILNRIKEVTGSKSVEANRALVEANVIRGTKVAVELQKLETEDHTRNDIVLQKRLDVDEPYNRTMAGPAASMYTDDGKPRAYGNNTVPSHVAAEAGQLQLDSERNGAIESITQAEQTTADVYVAGSLAIDLACDYIPRTGAELGSPEPHTSNPARITQTLGGVGHNVARAAHLMGANVRLCSVVGDDLAGSAAIEALHAAGMSTEGIKSVSSTGVRTGQYVAINDANKDLIFAMADFSLFEKPSTIDDSISKTFESFWLPQFQKHKPSILALDGNWIPEYLARWLQAGKNINSTILYEPVSKAKSISLFHIREHQDLHNLGVFPNPSVHIATPNRYEQEAMYTAAREGGHCDSKEWWSVIDALGIPHTGARVQMALTTSSELVDHGVPQMSIQLLPFIPCILTKLGAEGVLLTQILSAGDERLTNGEYAPYILSRCQNGSEESLGVGGVYMRLFPSVETVRQEYVESVNGVGDTFAGTLLAGLSKRGKGARVEEIVDLAQRAAVLTLKSRESVSPGLGTLSMLL